MQPVPLMPTRRLPDQDGICSRIKRVMLERADNRQALLAEMAGIQPGMLSKLLNGRESINPRHIQKIEAATGVRAVWLETGVEPMYHPGNRAPVREQQSGEGVRLKAYLGSHGIRPSELAERMNRARTTVSGYFGVERFDMDTRKAILSALDATEEEIFTAPVTSVSELAPNYQLRINHLNEEPVITLPFVPLRARAGVATPRYWEQPPETTRIMRATLADYEPDPLNPRRSWWVIEVDGDSMEPQLISRARVLGYYMKKENLADLKPGVWAIQYEDDFVIKRVRANNL
ncbi:MAG: hypothetical protein JWP57_1534, partial [Spirosoma sp.]|nr:hypothetical protein [Spirosoma sp.]